MILIFRIKEREYVFVFLLYLSDNIVMKSKSVEIKSLKLQHFSVVFIFKMAIAYYI